MEQSQSAVIGPGLFEELQGGFLGGIRHQDKRLSMRLEWLSG
jgi:hypothetical protein